MRTEEYREHLETTAPPSPGGEEGDLAPQLISLYYFLV